MILLFNINRFSQYNVPNARVDTLSFSIVLGTIYMYNQISYYISDMSFIVSYLMRVPISTRIFTRWFRLLCA
jgi:hypothetical protein